MPAWGRRDLNARKTTQPKRENSGETAGSPNNVSIAHAMGAEFGSVFFMSSKNKRMASRQSRIRQQRRRRGGGRARGTAVAAPESAATGEIRRSGRSPLAVGDAPPSSVAAAAPSSGATVAASVGVSDAQASAPIAARRRAARRVPSEPLPMYAHLGSEIRRIGALTALMAVALAVLTVFMR